MRYSIEPRERRYVKCYGFLSFAKSIGKNLSNKYGQKLVDTAKKSATDAFKIASKRAIQKKLKQLVKLVSLAKGKITITGAGDDAAARQADERDKGVAFKNCAPFTNCISEINNTQIYNCKASDIVMSLYNLLEYSDNYAKTSASLWQYYRDEPNDNL